MKSSVLQRLFVFTFGVTVYFFFLAVFLVFVAFVGDFIPPGWPFSAAPATDPWRAASADFLLIVVFGVPHSLMARHWFKAWLTQWIPAYLERTVYVLVSSLLLLLVIWQWQPIGPEIWHVDAPLVRYAIYALFALGWTITFVATFLTDHFDLFGLRQVFLHLLGRAYTPPKFTHRFLYRAVRHPMMLGMFIALWATPVMTLSHLVLAIGMSLYIMIGVRLEEQGLLRDLGEGYRHYHARTPMFVPRPAGRPLGTLQVRPESKQA